MSLVLRQLTLQDEKAFFEGLKAWEGEPLYWYTFAWSSGMSFPEMLEILRKEHLGIDLKPDRVPATMLYGFVDDKIIGRVSVRHDLNEYLRLRGGHIGYSVAPAFRRQGYATEMMAQALEFCRSHLQLSSVLVTCADDNTASWKVIEHFGGVLEQKIFDEEDEEMIRKYWIDLKAPSSNGK